MFVCNDTEVTAEMSQDFLQPQFSPSGSNARAAEEQIVYNWVTYVQETGGTYACIISQEIPIILVIPMHHLPCGWKFL